MAKPFVVSQQTFAGNKGPLEIPTPDGDLLHIRPLGAGNEVGRSCIMLTFKEKNIMLDCGVHPGRPGIAGLPFFDVIDPAKVDLLLISHFHLDHCAALPFFMEKTWFKGKVYMTHPTKPIYKMILSDYVKVSNIAIDELLYNENDIERTMDKIDVINYHQVIEEDGVRFWCYNAGHVLGAAMFMIEIAGVHILYTGDYSRQETRHLMAAEIPSIKPDVLIVESTYGVQNHEPRLEREERFIQMVLDTVVKNSGRCLIPVFALGSAQELLLILEEHWRKNSSLHHIPIYYASALAARCMQVYQTYINMMNDKILERNKKCNPFDFQHINYLRGMDNFQDAGPCVILASPGMLQSGFSRQLFEKWCENKSNCVIIPGYCVEGTLAKTILNRPSTVPTMTGDTLALNMRVDYVSFAAHSDCQQTQEFIEILQPPHIILVHGDANEMGRLKTSLEEIIQKKNRNMTVYNPLNTITVSIPFSGEKTAMVIGSLADQHYKENDTVSGIMVEKGFKHSIIRSDDIKAYTTLSTTSINMSQKVPFSQQFKLLSTCLSTMYHDIKKMDFKGFPTLLVSDSIYVLCEHATFVRLEWESNPVHDMLADSVLSLILQIEAHPGTQTLIGSSCCSNPMEKAQTVVCFLQRHFNDVELDERTRTVTIQVDETIAASIDLKNGTVSCPDKDHLAHITNIFNSISAVTEPF